MFRRVFHKRGKGCGEPSEGRCAVSKGEGDTARAGETCELFGASSPRKSKKTLSSRDWDESVCAASWCHPISEQPGRSLLSPCCGGGGRACLQARW